MYSGYRAECLKKQYRLFNDSIEVILERDFCFILLEDTNKASMPGPFIYIYRAGSGEV